jgi:hypothetical protein
MASFYWIIQAEAVADPTAAQIIQGRNGSNQILPATQHGSTVDTGQASPLNGSTATELMDGENYELFWAWDDGAGATSNVVKHAFATVPYTYILNSASAVPGSISNIAFLGQVNLTVA